MGAYKLLEVFGIELEYMIADKLSLDVMPIADKLFMAASGSFLDTVERGIIDWSNELALHVVELKNPLPSKNVLDLCSAFSDEINTIDSYLDKFGAILLPSGVHPWMNPERETKLWPHDGGEIYRTYDRLFGCKRHGWANLQSMHVNLPFGNESEFEQLHSAIRCILPLIPALSSSSPIIDGQVSGIHSNRLQHYLKNQKKIPSIMGLAIPERISTKQEYGDKILQPMYADIGEIDASGLLKNEWLNSRGAIARFDRNCIEIRLFDVQEAPFIDLAIAEFWITTLRHIILGKFCDFNRVRSLETMRLREVLDATIRDGEMAQISYGELLNIFGLNNPCTAFQLLETILEKVSCCNENVLSVITYILRHGTLSTRILRRYRESGNLVKTFLPLSECLRNGQFYEAY
ncbi:MAG: glutamate--cysteine ligase [Deltaproteobacteria bacterium]|nr:glutamate--cysteine ligase [Deltaproteobacteria bacterium]